MTLMLKALFEIAYGQDLLNLKEKSMDKILKIREFIEIFLIHFLNFTKLLAN
jgi:hypothetical protein